MKIDTLPQPKSSQNPTKTGSPLSQEMRGAFSEKDVPVFNSEAWFATPDLRSSSRGMLLEISVTWQDILLDIAHYRHPRRITFGSHPRADFCYSLFSSLEPLQKISPFPLIEASRSGEYLVCFDSDMDGTIDENGEQMSFLDLVKAGRAHSFSRHGLFYYSLQPGATVRLSCYEHTHIQIRFVSAPTFPKAWFGYLDSHVPVLSFSLLIHILMTCLAILSVASPSQTTTPKKSPVVTQSQNPKPTSPNSTQHQLIGDNHSQDDHKSLPPQER